MQDLKAPAKKKKTPAPKKADFLRISFFFGIYMYIHINGEKDCYGGSQLRLFWFAPPDPRHHASI
jgi:hypothetical protein